MVNDRHFSWPAMTHWRAIFGDVIDFCFFLDWKMDTDTITHPTWGEKKHHLQQYFGRGYWKVLDLFKVIFFLPRFSRSMNVSRNT